MLCRHIQVCTSTCDLGGMYILVCTTHRSCWRPSAGAAVACASLFRYICFFPLSEQQVTPMSHPLTTYALEIAKAGLQQQDKGKC